jgi:hypothetical protein
MESSTDKEIGDVTNKVQDGVVLADSERKTERKKQRSAIQKSIICLVVAVSLASSVLTAVAYQRFFGPKNQEIVAIDIKGYISEQKNLYLTGKLSDDQLKKNLDHLEEFIKSVPKNKVMIMGDAVIGNVEVLKP